MSNRIFTLLPGGVKHNYRSDIDGLRAIACLAVVLFHAFPSIMSGGFIGVDIFFVISGFLISSILYRSLFCDNPGKINIIDFYIRRIRRIFPALIVVLLACLFAGWFILLPEEYKFLGKHSFGGATYFNNIMLYKESSQYFNPESNTKPLLHLWSLGVEEQFYLVFPILLLILYKTRLNFLGALLFFTLVSFSLNILSIKTDNQSAAFYLPWCRFWELSFGAVLAYVVGYKRDFFKILKVFFQNCKNTNFVLSTLICASNKKHSKFLNHNICSVIGLSLIVFSCFSIQNDLSFPGVKALIPVIGSLLIIAAGKTTVVNRYILSNRVMVFLGLISYPLYLWHWPLLSFAYICEGQTPDSMIRLTAVIISLVLATITYFFIEPPLRYGSKGKFKAVFLLIFLICIGVFGRYTYKISEGFKHRFPSYMYEITRVNTEKWGAAYLNLDDRYIDNCKIVFPHWNDLDPNTTCAWQSKQGKNNIAIIGSSHAATLFYGLSETYKKTNNSVAVFPMGSQSPFINLKTNIQHSADWYKRIVDSYDYVLAHDNIELVVLSNLTCGPNNVVDIMDPSEKDFHVLYFNSVKRSLDALRHKKVIIVLDNPYVPFDPQICRSRPFTITNKAKSKESCSFDESITFKQRNINNEIIKTVAKSYINVRVFDLAPLFCQDGMCNIKINSKVMYLDQSHINADGSLYVASHLQRVIDELLVK